MSKNPSMSLDERYGRNPKGKRRTIIAVAMLGAVFITWLTWAALQHARPIADVTLVSFNIKSDREVSVRYEVGRRDANVALVCTLVARDFQTSIVGEIRDQISAGSSARVARDTSFPTRARAATVMIERCSPLSG